MTVGELFKTPGGKPKSFKWDKRVISWRNVFLALDRGLKLHEQLPWKPFRKTALERARKLDGGTFGTQRRSGHDLSGDDEFDLCAAG